MIGQNTVLHPHTHTHHSSMNKNGGEQAAEDVRPRDCCNACSDVRIRHAKIAAESANLLVSWASLLAEKEMELKLLQEKSLCWQQILATGGDPADYYEEDNGDK